MAAKPWDIFTGNQNPEEETQRKQTGDAQEVSGAPTGSSSETQQDESWDKAPTMQPVDVVAQRPPQQKTEVDENGVPVDKSSPAPGDFTVDESALGQPMTEENPDTSATNGINDSKEPKKENNAGSVKPLSVNDITPTISGDPNETEEQKQARIEKRKLENYAQEHPWVLEKDYSTMRNKYKDKKWSQIVSDVADYRRKIGKPMSYEEQMMMLSQYPGNTSKKEEVREKRLAYWADALNQLGNVLAHFYNYGRAKGGSPAAQIPDNKSSYSERLRAADMAMRQRGYNDYVNAVVNEQKRKQTLADNMATLKQKLEFETLAKKYQLDNDPEMKKKYELLCEQGETQKAKTIAAKYDADKKKAEALDIPKENIRKQEEHEVNMALKQSQINKNNRSGGGKGSGGGKAGGSSETKPKASKLMYAAGEGDKKKLFATSWEAYQYAKSLGTNPAQRRVKKNGRVEVVDVNDKDIWNLSEDDYMKQVGVTKEYI